MSDIKMHVYEVREGHVSEGKTYVYVWLEPGGVVYVGPPGCTRRPGPNCT